MVWNNTSNEFAVKLRRSIVIHCGKRSSWIFNMILLHVASCKTKLVFNIAHLSILLRYTDSDCPFDILKLFLWNESKLRTSFNIRYPVQFSLPCSETKKLGFLKLTHSNRQRTVSFLIVMKNSTKYNRAVLETALRSMILTHIYTNVQCSILQPLLICLSVMLM